MESDDDALIPPREFYEIIGLAKTPVKEKLNPDHPRYDPDLPRPVKLGPNCYRYSKREALRYVALKMARRDQENQKRAPTQRAAAQAREQVPA